MVAAAGIATADSETSAQSAQSMTFFTAVSFDRMDGS
jgi:hypothetical protein